MIVTVRLFAALRERAGTAEISLEAPDESTVAAIESLVVQRHPKLSDLLSKSAVAVNRAYASRQTVLHDGDELALIPPVSGG
jgi:molybdopterin converting factor subunit 1